MSPEPNKEKDSDQTGAPVVVRRPPLTAGQEAVGNLQGLAAQGRCQTTDLAQWQGIGKARQR